jgi:3-hydroxy-9,10-secoandrosta-1,3,5(10)-triene-9,17-dione monooxygenase reductase component
MRRLASPVTVVTAATADQRRGATIGSFTSVSLEPPLVSFNVIRGTGFHSVLRDADRLAIHILRDDQAALADHFAIPDLSEDEQFSDVALRAEDGETALPILEHSLAVLWCRPYDVLLAGDHDLFVAIVEHVEASEVTGEHGPLLYFARTYRALGQEV